MIVTDKFKSFSLFTQDELQESILRDIDNMTDAERAVFFEMLQNPGFESDLNALELDREMVSVEQWIEDDYYMGHMGKTVYRPWKDDLLELFESSQYDTAVVVGGIGCSSECSGVWTDQGRVAMGDLNKPHRYLSRDQGGFARYIKGTHAFVKGKAMLYRVQHGSGHFDVTAHHRVMCSDGQYRRVDQLQPGQAIFSFSDDSIQSDASCVQRLMRTIKGCLDDCLPDSHLCDGLLQLAKDIGQSFFPLQDDAFWSSFDRFESMDEQLVTGQRYSHQRDYSVYHSRSDFWNPWVDQLSFGSSPAYVEIFQRCYGFFQQLQQFQKVDALPHIARALVLFAEQTFPVSSSNFWHQHGPRLKVLAGYVSKHNVQQYQVMDDQEFLLFLSRIFVRLIAHGFASSRQSSKAFDSKAGQAFAPRPSPLQRIGQWLRQSRRSLFQRMPLPLLSLSRLGLVSANPLQIPFSASIVHSIEKIKTDWYWDLQVPATNNYLMGGAVHHNSGKSTFSHLAVLRMVYEASCLKNPALSYGLASNSNISFCSLAKSKETARRVVFEQLAAKIQESPYFKYDFPPIKDLKDEILFPKGLGIICGSSTDTSIIGMNVFGGIIDEVNFWGKVKKSNLNYGKNWGSESKSARLFDSVRRRMKSRYVKKGKLPGILVMVSSKTTKDAFTEQFIRKEQALGNKSTFVRDRSILEVKKGSFSSKTFRVLIGTIDYASRILAEGEDISHLEGATTIEIPDDFRIDFETNLEDSLRDIAGVSTIALANFIAKVEKINEMVDPERVHPFHCALMDDPTTWDSRKPYTINWYALCNRKDNGDWVPKRSPDAPRHVHFDPAFTGDSFGLAIAHIEDMVPIQKEGIIEYQPLFDFDFLLDIQGSKNEEVLFWKVRELIYEFAAHGFHFAEFSMDTYQSREMIQQLEQNGYKAGVYSVDTGISSRGENVVNLNVGKVPKAKQAYWYMRSAIYEGRAKCYDYPKALGELRRLEDGPDKVDHPEGGSKDLADAMTGVVWTLFRSKMGGEWVGPSKGHLVNPVSPDGETMLEYADSIQEHHSNSEPQQHLLPSKEVLELRGTKVYEKKKPKTVSPKYQKVNANGTVVDLTLQPDDVLQIG